jgi:hypothetical protein
MCCDRQCSYTSFMQGVTQASLASHYKKVEQHPKTVQRTFWKARLEKDVFYLVFGSGKSLIKVRLQTAVERIIVPQRIAAYPARRQALGIPADDAVVPEELAAPEPATPPEPPSALPTPPRLNVCFNPPSKLRRLAAFHGQRAVWRLKTYSVCPPQCRS